jgi:multidrug resistance protein, MATE family
LATPDPTLREELAALFRLSWPIAVAQLGLMAMGLVDTAILGRVSVTELAGSSIGRSISFAAITPAMGIALALEPLASQAVGAGELPRAWGALRASVRAVLAAWAPLMALCFIGLMSLERCGVDAPVASRARAYALAQAPGMLFTLVFLTNKTFLQSRGSTRPALVAAGVANVVNLVVCNLLVRGDDFLAALGVARMGLPKLGAFGAGLAFSIAELVMVCIVASASLKLRPRGPIPHVPMALVARLGMPVGLQLLAEIGVFAASAVIVGRFGPAAVSAHQVALGLASFTFMGALGISGGTAVRVGYAVGQGRSPRRAGLIGFACGGLFMALCGTAFAVFSRGLVRLFTQDTEVLALGADLVVIAAVFQLFDGLQAVGGGALRGAGDVRYPFIATVIAHWAVGFPAAIFLGLYAGMGVRGIWWGLASGLICVSGLLVTRFLRVSQTTIARV